MEAGKVSVAGIPVTKPGALVSADTDISLQGEGPRYVSRGGEKLEGALRGFDVEVSGRRWLDAGASTGGFTDCLLKHGASSVAAVDVGYGELSWRLRTDPRVVVLERTNVRNLKPADLPWMVDGVTADLSFISLRLVLPALTGVAKVDADFIVLVKPQFEAGREEVGRGGVVRSSRTWKEALVGVARAAATQGLATLDAAPSPLRGPKGNVEFFLHLSRVGENDPGAIDRALDEVNE